MGRMLRIEACPVCNYHVESELYYGGSTRSRLFLHHRYELAHCHACRSVVSVLVPLPEYDLPSMLEKARQDIATLEGLAAEGDAVARRLLPLHQLALQDDPDDDTLTGLETGLCTNCGSGDLTLFPGVGGDNGEHFADGTAWLACPCCDEGQIWLRQVATWDELDSGL
jgi:hypothetical protein